MAKQLMSGRVLLLYGMLLAVHWSVIFGQEICSRPSGVELTCVCEVDGATIDLTSISYDNGSPKFPEIQRINDIFAYSYNPCYGYLQGPTESACGGNLGKVSSCQFDINGDDMYSLGDSTTETIYIDRATGNNYVQYTNGQEGRITKVYLICDPNADTPTITADGDGETPLVYLYYLTTKCACPGTCSYVGPTGPGGGGGGGGNIVGVIGIVIIILSLVALVAYFVTGAVIMNVRHGKTGTDIIPQKEFWSSLPFLVKDGCVFTFKPFVTIVKKRQSEKGDYQSF